MRLNNQAFRKQSAKKSHRKLDVVLRQLTGDALTEEQRQGIRRALGYHRQYRIRLCPSRYAFRRAVDPSRIQDGSGTVRILLDDAECPNDAPMAALVRWRAPGKRENTVYLYLPKLKEAMRDETRTKEAKET